MSNTISLFPVNTIKRVLVSHLAHWKVTDSPKLCRRTQIPHLIHWSCFCFPAQFGGIASPPSNLTPTE